MFVGEATRDELNKMGPGTCESLPADLAKFDGVEKLVAELSKREKRQYSILSLPIPSLRIERVNGRRFDE